MKKLYITLILLFTSMIAIVSCGPNLTAPHDSTADSRELASVPIKSDSTNPPLEVLGVYRTSGGNLYVYKFGKDTIYLAQGVNSYPVSLQVK